MLAAFEGHLLPSADSAIGIARMFVTIRKRYTREGNASGVGEK